MLVLVVLRTSCKKIGKSIAESIPQLICRKTDDNSYYNTVNRQKAGKIELKTEPHAHGEKYYKKLSNYINGYKVI